MDFDFLKRKFVSRSGAITIVVLSLVCWLAIRGTLILPIAFAAGQGTYSTNFPLTENPISEAGKWINGKATGLKWADVRTTPGFVFGTQTATVLYDDSTAVLTGSWGSNQTAQATIRVVASDATQFEEVEVRLNTTITSNSITGYEINCSVKSNNPYSQVVRWNGPLGSWTGIGGSSTGCRNGDVLKATNVNGTITAYLNGSAIFSATDHTYSGGSPGVGFYIQNGSSSTNANFGFSAFSATDGSATVLAPTSLSATVH